jgi:hypothetical protein
MNIGEVLSKAWNILWKHKVLWIFGILAGCTANYGNTSSYSISGEDLPAEINYQISQIDPAVLTAVGIFLIIAAFLVIILFIFLGTIGRIGLIRGAKQADQGVEKLSFGELFRGSMPYFWRVFFLYLVVGIAAFLAIVAFATFTVIGTALTLGLLAICLIPVFCLIAPIAWLITIILEQASIAIVSENLGVLEGLARGWEVFKANFGTMVGMGLILLVAGLVAGFIIGIPLFILAIPAILTLTQAGGQFDWSTMLIYILLGLLYLPVLIFLTGLIRTYVGSAWTLTFLRLTAKPPAPAPEPLPDPVTSSSL